MSDSPPLRKDADSVIKRLDVKKFIEDQRPIIYEKLEVCDTPGQGVLNGDMLFIAESLPIINGIIHVGSTRKTFNDALDYVKGRWSEADPGVLLQALVFIYVVEQAYRDIGTLIPVAKKPIWDRIRKRVREIASDMEETRETTTMMEIPKFEKPQ